MIEFFNTIDNYDQGRSLRVKKRKVRKTLRQRCFSQRVVDAWNGLLGEVVAPETVDRYKLELDRHYLEDTEVHGN